jgi:predicted nuclease of predicted toxin-antitoxin system
LRILLDECVDRRLAGEIAGHQVTTTQQKGWSGTDNVELLKLAESDFDVFLTVDRNLSFQQPIVDFDIAVVVIRAASNRLTDLRVLIQFNTEIADGALYL